MEYFVSGIYRISIAALCKASIITCSVRLTCWLHCMFTTITLISQKSNLQKLANSESMERTYLARNRINGKWDCKSFSLEGENHSYYGLTWPAAKYYTCSFCKREFKSAQALGGHMNVHRKDRARLRLLSSCVLDRTGQKNPKPNSNPNPSFSSVPSNLISSPSLNISLCPHNSLLSPPSLGSNPSSSLQPYGENRRKPMMIPQLGENFPKDDQSKTVIPFLGVKNLMKNAPTNELELDGLRGLGLEKEFEASKDVLDLELRLGHF